MRILACAVFLAGLAAAAPARAQDGGSDHWDARITNVTGTVVVHPADGSTEVDADADMPLEQGDRVVTSAGATAEIALDGGSLMTLSENSDFTLENTQKSASIFSLSLGSLLAKIQKLGTQSLSIRSPTSVAAVRGTERGLHHVEAAAGVDGDEADVEGDGGQSHVGVFDEGRVEVQGSSGGRPEVLTPNQETSVARGQVPMRATPLRRFAGRREAMRARVRRLESVRRNWRPLSADQRGRRRAGALEHGRDHRSMRLQRRAQRRNPTEHADQSRENPSRDKAKRETPANSRPGRKIPKKGLPKSSRERDAEHEKARTEERR